MIVLVGGNGFLGQHVRQALSASDYPAVIVSRRHEATSENERFMSADTLRGPAGDTILREAKAIVYLASQSVPSTFAQEPEKEVFSSVEPATAFFSRCAHLRSTARLVLISSGGTVYGNAGFEPLTEDTPVAPVSPYGLGKLMIEEALKYVGRSYVCNFSILRVSNPVGKYQTGNVQGLVSIALRCLESGAALPFIGSGDQVRDYVDADDVAAAIVKVCFLGDSYSGEIWNVGSGVGYSVGGVVNMIETITGMRLRLEHLAERPFDVKHVVLDVGKIKNDLGWTPSYTLPETIERVWHSRGHS
jgi:UDP-glucose 4-epimerase